MPTTRQPFNENKAWDKLPASQKSYSVSLLHFFHFRRQRIAACWRQEEMLTWELYQCLRVLPRQLFLQPLLELIAHLSPVRDEVPMRLIQDLGRLTVTNSPSLHLQGNKRNSCSDIGIDSPDGTALWLEAKVARLSPASLLTQLQTQQSALAAIARPAPGRVVALLPAFQARPEWPTITWSHILDIITVCRTGLGKLDPDTFGGLSLLADELAGRISEHPLQLVR